MQDVPGRQEVLAGGGWGEPQAVPADPVQQWDPAPPPQQPVPALRPSHTSNSQEQPPLREAVLGRRLQGEQATAEVNIYYK